MRHPKSSIATHVQKEPPVAFINESMHILRMIHGLDLASYPTKESTKPIKRPKLRKARAEGQGKDRRLLPQEGEPEPAQPRPVQGTNLN